MTLPVRETPAAAVHASPTATVLRPVTRVMVLRVLAIATLVGIFISLFGPFDQGLRFYLVRSSINLVFAWTGSLLGMATVRLVWRMGFYQRSFWMTGLVAGLLMAAPMAAIVFCGVSLWNGHWLAVGDMGEMLWDNTLICIGSCFAAALVARRAQNQPGEAQPVKFLERLPLKLRGAEVWAVEAEDHYLRLHTSKGQDLILLRLADAIAELEGIEGAQVHRSWWVARDAITQARKGDGRATLTLKDGAEVPVSRTYAGQLREKRWI